MSNTVNRHGVAIECVSALHRSFSAASGIVADDVTPALVARIERARDDEAPLDTIAPVCWLIERATPLVDVNTLRSMTERVRASAATAPKRTWFAARREYVFARRVALMRPFGNYLLYEAGLLY